MLSHLVGCPLSEGIGTAHSGNPNPDAFNLCAKLRNGRRVEVQDVRTGLRPAHRNGDVDYFRADVPGEAHVLGERQFG